MKLRTASCFLMALAASAARGAETGPLSPGSLYIPGSALADLGADPKARQVGDVLTILVSERASGTAKGATNTSRKSEARYSVGAIFGPLRSTGPLADLARGSGASQLEGQGETSRETVLSTTLAARVIHVLPNGVMAVEGVKEIAVDSERQAVIIRGLVRPVDVSPGNIVRSERIAQLEVRINGRGVVGDAVRRPFFLYRILMGLLPF